MDDKILIDRNTLKAISSDTKISILKLLNKRRYTLSEISEKVNLSNATVKEHLEHLMNSELVLKEETERKWKYYFLTKKGKKLLEPKAITIYLTFIISLFATFGMVSYFILSMFTSSASIGRSAKSMPESMIVKATSDSAQSEVLNQVTSAVPEVTKNMFTTGNWIVFVIIILIITTIILFIIYLRKKRKNKYSIKVI